jgi:gamma-glutamyl:cysteine ligase YbdK (ATP-grasp superfamily)
MPINSTPDERFTLGVELESYTIATPGFRISREMAFPRKGVGEHGERFGRDASVGTEYNGRPFQTIREGFFLLKAGLRKYSLKLYRTKSTSRIRRQLLLVGGWRDRFAGAHLHLALVGEELTKERARHLAWHLHDHLPLLVAVMANSPVWGDELTEIASNRVERASRVYFHPIARRVLTSRAMDEMTFSRARKTKPATLELRVMDSNIPEFVIAAACIVKAAALTRRSGRRASNLISHSAYLRSRSDAARRGMKAHLCWNGEWLTARSYLDRFVWVHRDELEKMDIPQDVWTAFKLLKKGLNGSAILTQAVRRAHLEHPQTWQRRFAKRYMAALDHLLAGNSILDFIERLGVEVPDLDDVWLGRRRMRLA